MTTASSGRRGRRGWGSTAVAVLLVAVMLFPVYWMLNVSLQPGGGGAVASPWLPLHPDVSGYAKALRDQGSHLLTSLVVSLGSVVVSLVLATPAAYALAQFRLRFTDAFLLGILVSQMVPGIVVANALYGVYSDLGLLNSLPGLVLADSSAGIPFAVLVLRAFMATVPGEVVEAARVDGAGELRTFWSVVVPMSRNALVTAGLFTFLFTWSDFLFALTLTTTDDVRPVTLGLYQYIGSYVQDWSAVMATAVLASLPAVVLLLVAQKYVAAGATAGALK
ncbi:MAG: carbohydrate ABC transporter permease [Actinobacteria bacterium]|nr:carbohydrate ABC transporter permease [Actinomycetota bacterium]